MLEIIRIHNELLGTYGDRGNSDVLQYRAGLRKIKARVTDISYLDPLPRSGDIYLLGGAEDAAQLLSLTALRKGSILAGLSRKHIMESVHASLKRLGTDHIDLYQMHRFDFEAPLEESLRAFEDLVRQGKVHYIGFSEWNAQQINDALGIQKANGWTRFVSSQPQYSMLWRVIEREVVPLSEQEGIGQIVWSPIAQGVLTGKYLPGVKPPAGSRATDKKSGAGMISRWMRDDVLTAVQNLKPIADEVGLSMSQLALAWALQNKNVSAVIMGATKPAQVKENVKASGVKLEHDVMAKIDAALGSLPETDPSKNESPNPRA